MELFWRNKNDRGNFYLFTLQNHQFFHKKSSKNCPPGGVQIVGCEASAEMDGAIVAAVHDEFRGMGRAGVVGEGAVVVDVRGLWDNITQPTAPSLRDPPP